VGVIVVGVDATDSGWIAAELVDGRLAEIRVFPDIQSVFVEYGERAAAIAIDMPIGLSEEGERSADKAARAFVGARASSVFAPPPRWVADLPDYAAAQELRPEQAKAITRQTFALVAKIKEVAQAVEAGARVYEIHTEVSFRALKGATMVWPEKTYQGTDERLRLLATAGIFVPLGRIAGSELDDAVDASIAAWSAQRIAKGEAQRLPAGAPSGVDGVIWY